ncbi:hypothetical protein [Micromonospora sp. CPCC 206061]|uniref:hypothetical protein n=1 Tax=Micromonospora sp. CPCC 206061 TaxID=3122410 RepID=UPI002FF3AA12
MSGIMTKWAVLAEYPVSEQDLDAAGVVSDEALVRWVDAARQAYLDGCPTLAAAGREPGVALRHRTAALPSGALLGRPADIVVTASAKEFRPASFTIAVRVRPGGGDREMPVNASCVIRLEDTATGEARELGNEIRDELIALEQSASHYN